MSVEVGSIVEGVVSGITNFGAFISLPGGQTGLVHISEVADAYVRDVKDYLKEKDTVQVKVITVDERGKISLSIRQAQPKPERSEAVQEPPPRSFAPRGGGRHDRGRGGPLDFEDRLTRFMKESEERLLDLRRATENKRGGRGARRG